MDPKRFDAISQRLGAIGDRRRALGALGALGGLVAVPLPAPDAEAKGCFKKNKTCVKDKKSGGSCKKCCSGCSVRKGTSSESNKHRKKVPYRCTCCPDGVFPKDSSPTSCCSGYINTATGLCQTTCAPTCAKCCPPPTGSSTPHCGTAAQSCCSTALGGGACTTGNECCNNTADCPVSKACVAGCCLPIT